MAEAVAKMSEPVMEGVVMTLTNNEASLLVEFLGATSIGTVEETLDWMSPAKQRDVNEVLYKVFEVLNKIVKRNYD